MAPRIAIIIHTLYHHTARRKFQVGGQHEMLIYHHIIVAEAEKAGILAAGGSATIYQFVISFPY
jgi:hypothetical protein